MTTEEFNKTRVETWTKKMNKDQSRIFMMVGIKENGTYSFVADDALSPEKIAQKLEDLARAIRFVNKKTN